MPVRLYFENKKILLLSYTKGKKNKAIGLNSDFFPTYFDGTLFVYISSCKYTPISIKVAPVNHVSQPAGHHGKPFCSGEFSLVHVH